MRSDREPRPPTPREPPGHRPAWPSHGVALLVGVLVVLLVGAAGWTMSGASASAQPVEPTATPKAGRTTTVVGTARPASRRPARTAPTRTARERTAAPAPTGRPAERAGGAPATRATTEEPVAARPAVLAPVPDRPRIMVLGDSITYGIGSTSRTGYRTALGGRLAAAAVAYDFVGSQHSGRGAGDLDHEGHPGWRIDEIAERIDGWMAVSRPDVVLLDIGTNDYVQKYRTDRAPRRLARLIDAILAASPAVRVVVAKLLVCAGAERAAGITAFNAAIPAIAAAAGPRVSIADMSRITTDDTVDGLHPDDLGYRKMAALWSAALLPLLGRGG